MTENLVVVGIDDAPDCESAIRWGATEAAARGAALRLVHAFVWPEFPVPLGPSNVAPGLRAYADRIVADSLDLATKLEPGLVIRAERVDGFPSPVLIRESHRASMVVIGSRELGGALGLLVGATGLDLAAHGHCPIIVVRPGELAESGSRVVIGYDGSPAADAALVFGLDYARRHDLATRVVAVQQRPTDPHRLAHHDLAAAVEAHGTGAATELIQVTGHPAEQLIQWSADARLIVVGSRGRGGFKGLLLGSVSQAVLHHADCPVAVIPHAAIQR